MSYSQAGQDTWLLGQFPPGYIGYAADVGAFDGVTHSNTLALEQQRRWTVLCIEPNPIAAKKLKTARPFVEACACDAAATDKATLFIHADNIEAYTSLRPKLDHPVYHPGEGAKFLKVPVPVKTLDDCLERWEFPRLDLLCIDTEGTERDVLKGCDLDRWKPHIILVECWDEGSLDDHLNPLGYQRIARLLVDDIYMRNNP